MHNFKRFISPSKIKNGQGNPPRNTKKSPQNTRFCPPPPARLEPCQRCLFWGIFFLGFWGSASPPTLWLIKLKETSRPTPKERGARGHALEVELLQGGVVQQGSRQRSRPRRSDVVPCAWRGTIIPANWRHAWLVWNTTLSNHNTNHRLEQNWHHNNPAMESWRWGMGPTCMGQGEGRIRWDSHITVGKCKQEWEKWHGKSLKWITSSLTLPTHSGLAPLPITVLFNGFGEYFC